MAIDPRQLRPGELARLLNSTPLGEVIGERQLHRHRTRAGFRVAPPGPDGDAGRIDLFRYVAWLVTTRHEALAQAALQPEGLTGYEAMKERARRRNAMLSLSGRDIGDLPDVVDPARKQKAAHDFRFFCEAYFPQTFYLKWSDDHLKVIAKIEQAVLEGGLFAMAMPRGSGKTSLCETACLWAMLYGHRDFVALIGSDEEHATSMLESIKAELESSDLLAADFPEVCHPIRCLEGIHQRAAGQLYRGKQTHIGWTAREIVLPTMPGSPAAGAIIRVAGITGRVRGMKHKRVDGVSVRPSLVLIDDPQTDESARSPSQCEERERILAGAILGLAGPGKKIAGLMTLTVVRPDDLADRILDRKKHPQWQGERTRMVYAWPRRQDLWDRYAEIRADGLRSDRGIKTATEFYRQHQAEMDEGALVAWPARYNHDEISALQHAMNLRLQNEAAFFAEYQNEPPVQAQPGDEAQQAAPEALAARCSGLPRGTVPAPCTVLTAFIDVHDRLLYWMTCAWESDGITGHIIDYGTEPDQRLMHFELRSCPRPLSAITPNAGRDGTIYAGLERLTDRLLRPWPRDGGGEARVERVLIDANWGMATSTVYRFCRQSRHAAVLIPGHGRAIRAGQTPMDEYRRRPGERAGQAWRMPAPHAGRAVRHIVYDTARWKSDVIDRLLAPRGAPGLWISGRENEHRLLIDHLCAETRTRVTARGMTADEWRARPGRDNHWLDCLVGCAVAASVCGVGSGAGEKESKAQRTITLSRIRGRHFTPGRKQTA